MHRKKTARIDWCVNGGVIHSCKLEIDGTEHFIQPGYPLGKMRCGDLVSSLPMFDCLIQITQIRPKLGQKRMPVLQLPELALAAGTHEALYLPDGILKRLLAALA